MVFFKLQSNYIAKIVIKIEEIIQLVYNNNSYPVKFMLFCGNGG